MKKLVEKYFVFVGKSPVVRSFLIISPLYVLTLFLLSIADLIDGSMKNPNANLLTGLNLYGLAVITILHIITVVNKQKISSIDNKGILFFCLVVLVAIATMFVIM